MSKATQAFVLSASRRSDGMAVFLDFDGAWNESITASVVARSPDEINALERRGAHDAANDLIVEPHLLPVQNDHGRLVPIHSGESNGALGSNVVATSQVVGSRHDLSVSTKLA